jgi:hypothetical protein
MMPWYRPPASDQAAPADYAACSKGTYLHRTLTGGIGHNLPQEAPLDFVRTIQEVDSFASNARRTASRAGLRQLAPPPLRRRVTRAHKPKETEDMTTGTLAATESVDEEKNELRSCSPTPEVGKTALESVLNSASDASPAPPPVESAGPVVSRLRKVFQLTTVVFAP